MKHQLTRLCFVSFLLSAFTLNSSIFAEDKSAPFRFHHSKGKIEIYAGKQAIATYEYQNRKTTRPYFAHVRTLQGTQVTRHHPPSPEDPQDHADLHPGIFLAFGDISGNDYWRLKSKVKHVGFVKTARKNSFAVRNFYLSETGESTICTEVCHYQFIKTVNGYLIDCQSTFQNNQGEFYFGDQEEMGLGVRVASFMREKGGNGRILNSQGITSAGKTWGQKADWCDYSGMIDQKQIGVMIMASPKNSRPTWWHNRNYGVFVANMFGRKAMKQGEESKLIIKQGERFELNYGIYIHESNPLSENDLKQTYREYVSRKSQ